MPELTIKYKNKKTLTALKNMANDLGFSIIEKTEKEDNFYFNGVKIIPGEGKIETNELESIFTLANLDAKKLREEAWKR